MQAGGKATGNGHRGLSCNDQGRLIMSDYRNPDYRNPDDPLWRGQPYEPATEATGASWAWIAGALVVVVLVAIAFGIGHEPARTASNDSPTAAHVAPPPVAPRAFNPAAPGLAPPPAPTTATAPPQ